MRFEADFSGPRTVLRALFESGDRHTGRSEEGTGTPITYSGEVIEFDYLPDENRVADLPEIESQWPLRSHPETFEFCDARWRPMIRERVLEHLEEMRPADIAEMQRWTSARCQT